MLFLEFEDTIAELEAELADLRHRGGGEEEATLQTRIRRALESIYGRLTPWQTIQVARHPERPGAREIIQTICSEFIELHGDRDGGNATFTTGGLARILDHSVVVIGHDRPRHTPGGTGCPKPDLIAGLKKATRLLALAQRFRLPVIILADGEDPEAHDIALPLSTCMSTALGLRVPIISVICGAAAGPSTALLMTADAVLIMQHATLSMLSPETSASALWADTTDKDRALTASAESLGIVANDLLRHGIVDAIIPEPLGGAHRAPQQACHEAGAAIITSLGKLRHTEGGQLRAKRRDRLAFFGRQQTQG